LYSVSFYTVPNVILLTDEFLSTFSWMSLYWVSFCLLPSVILLSAQCHYTECHSTKWCMSFYLCWMTLYKVPFYIVMNVILLSSKCLYTRCHSTLCTMSFCSLLHVILPSVALPNVMAPFFFLLSSLLMKNSDSVLPWSAIHQSKWVIMRHLWMPKCDREKKSLLLFCQWDKMSELNRKCLKIEAMPCIS